uniref:Pre-mRNA-splicing factor 38 n=1 Tax=Chromera velia CCMP2878 TaxID=1169474 RepID=A0A0G4FPA4_9ALVE|eukprot:Cvel_18055.t1-p1 / transcript=Cvel_18055.t1 / gene=Cvel_18055 / organism=Chromera_velia_CCMP2878 / gene_product=Pre-mRNA-splicing factor 38B, putative / transcript_product=Pre-mRNA-splicing factor 38B, putative / location=Cvel_scaffold1475:11103-18358(-) / protein_length=636 / sequence_SO=supercontig / SO=protein_coding / is_pseudo=false
MLPYPGAAAYGQMQQLQQTQQAQMAGMQPQQQQQGAAAGNLYMTGAQQQAGAHMNMQQYGQVQAPAQTQIGTTTILSVGGGVSTATVPMPLSVPSGVGGLGVSSFAPQLQVAGAAAPGVTGDEVGGVKRCHLHTKAVSSCKFCKKFKEAVAQQAALGGMAQANNANATKGNQVEMTNTNTFNFNDLLRSMILKSEYFKSLMRMMTFDELYNEIMERADHAEPWVAKSGTKSPSTLFCCLYRLMMIRLTDYQMKQLLDSVDSVYVRCAGFLFLRYVHPPEKIWSWWEPYFLDDEEFAPGSDKTKKMTIGQWLETLITEDKYYGTIPPRLPVKVKNQYGTQLLALNEHRRRKRENKQRLHRFVAGTEVEACSNGDWLLGVLMDPPLNEEFTGRLLCRVRLEDDSEEEIDIGLVILQGGGGGDDHWDKERDRDGGRSRSRSRDRDRDRSRSRDRDTRESGRQKTEEELLAEFRRREQEKAIATGKDYARRPTSYKSSLSVRVDWQASGAAAAAAARAAGAGERERDGGRGGGWQGGRERDRGHPQAYGSEWDRERGGGGGYRDRERPRDREPEADREKTGPSAEQQAKMKALMEKSVSTTEGADREQREFRERDDAKASTLLRRLPPCLATTVPDAINV